MQYKLNIAHFEVMIHIMICQHMKIYWAKKHPILIVSLYHNAGQKNKVRNKVKNPVKLDKTRNVWYLLLHASWLLLPKFIFFQSLNVSTQIWDFSNIFSFPKILSLKVLCNLWGYSYTKFVIQDIKSSFTCGNSDLC